MLIGVVAFRPKFGQKLEPGCKRGKSKRKRHKKKGKKRKRGCNSADIMTGGGVSQIFLDFLCPHFWGNK